MGLIRKLTELAMEHLGTKLPADTHVDAGNERMLEQIGTNGGGAAALVKRRFENLTETLGPSHFETLTARSHLASTLLELRRRRLPPSTYCSRSLVDEHRASRGETNPLTLDALHSYGKALLKGNRLPPAIDVLRGSTSWSPGDAGRAYEDNSHGAATR